MTDDQRNLSAREFAYLRSLRRRLFDRDYSPAFQDEYQRLWHEAAYERDRLLLQLKRLGWKRYMVDDEDERLQDAKLIGHYDDAPDHDYTKQPKGNRPPFGVCLIIWRREAKEAAA